MRYLVKARLKPGKAAALLRAIETGDLGKGSVAGDEYEHNMRQARVGPDGVAHWVETCFCATPLGEERPYWEEYFDLLSVKDAHARKNCRHENGTQPWACSDCDCTAKLESKMALKGAQFLEALKTEIQMRSVIGRARAPSEQQARSGSMKRAEPATKLKAKRRRRLTRAAK